MLPIFEQPRIRYQEAKKMPQIVIQEKIRDRVYAFDEDIFRNKKRFEMIQSVPNKGTKYLSKRTLFKGRFRCQNPECQVQVIKKKDDVVFKSKQQTPWSSSLSHIIFYYFPYPGPLKHFKEYYYDQNKRCQIYFFVQLYGQKCQKCNFDKYCYPFFGDTQMKRISKCFSRLISDQIQQIPFRTFKPCALRRLEGHRSDLCQACERDDCRQGRNSNRGGGGKERIRRDNRRNRQIQN